MMSSDNIYQSILQNIIHLRLEPGSLISENQTANEYGVSRSVIRTIFARLSQLGFVNIYPQRGSYVSRIDPDYIRNLLIIRAAIEKEAVYSSIYELSPEKRRVLLDRLSDNLEKQRLFADSVIYPVEYSALDKEFHDILLWSVNKKGVMDIIEDRLLHVARFRNFSMTFINQIGVLIKEHEDLFSAIQAGNIRAGLAVIDRHLEDKVRVDDAAIKNYKNTMV